MEISVGVITSGAGSTEAVDWKRLGTLRFDSNKNSGFLARELKRICVTAEGDLLRLSIAKCHSNELNTYSQVRHLLLMVIKNAYQVGIVAIRVLGDALMDLPPKSKIERVEDVNLDPESLHLYQKLLRWLDTFGRLGILW